MSTRMFGRVGYIGEVLQCRRVLDSHNHGDRLTFLKYLNTDIL